MMRSRAVVLAMCALAAACGTPSTASTAAQDVPPPTATAATPSPGAVPSAPSAPPRSLLQPLGKERSWRITTYYTAVQSFHGGKPKAVRGCPQLHCKWGKTPLGSYPEDFLKVIRTEGSGRITSGPQRGRYLNWSSSTGWWLDDSTRDSTARPLKAWSSAAADRDVITRGRSFRIADCGTDRRGRPVPARICDRFRAATWTVTDLFRPGYGGEHHADVYIGEETGPDFAKSPYYTTLTNATIGRL